MRVFYIGNICLFMLIFGRLDMVLMAMKSPLLLTYSFSVMDSSIARMGKA